MGGLPFTSPLLSVGESNSAMNSLRLEQLLIFVSIVSQAVLTLSLYVLVALAIAVPFSAFLLFPSQILITDYLQYFLFD